MRKRVDQRYSPQLMHNRTAYLFFYARERGLGLAFDRVGGSGKEGSRANRHEFVDVLEESVIAEEYI